VFIAPCQMKANGGVLIIDDFGRQAISASDLLNRWIVPLERGVDYLELNSGLKFQAPFRMTVIFCSEMKPAELGREEFLRRIAARVLVDGAAPEVFDRIFERVVADQEAEAEPGAAAFLRELCLAAAGRLRACFPTDIVRLVKAVSQYERRPVRITRAELERAAETYFAGACASAD